MRWQQLRWSLRSDNLLAFLSRVELLLGLQSTAVCVELVASEEDAGVYFYSVACGLLVQPI